MAKETTDPYETYIDGKCRDISGQIVDCMSEHAVSPAKYPRDHKFATKEDKERVEPETQNAEE